MPARLKRQVVSYRHREAPGTIIIDTPNTYLYYVLVTAARCAMASASAAMALPGRAYSRSPRRPSGRTGPAPGNDRTPALSAAPHGRRPRQSARRSRDVSRGTIYRIHGTNAPQTIGTQVSSGCIRLTNADVADLYSRVNVGTKVIVLPDRRADNTSGKRG